MTTLATEHKVSEKQSTVKKQFLGYIHAFRGFAILIIVAIHCRMSVNWETGAVSDFLKVLLDNGTIFFILISGFLFSYLHRNGFAFGNYLSKKIKYVLIPYLIFSVIPLIDKLFIESGNQPWMPEGLSGNMLPEIFFMLVSGKHFGPFWFIPVIFSFYFISPFLLYFRNRSFFTTLTFILIAGGLFCWQFGYYSSWWLSFLFFIPVFILGIFIEKYKERVLNLSMPFLIFLIGVYVLCFVMELYEWLPVYRLYNFDNELPMFSFSVPKLKTLILAVLLLVFFRKNESSLYKYLSLFATYSFSIFFIHLYLIVFLENFHVQSYVKIPDWAYFFLLIILVGGGSLILSFLFKKLFGKYSRYIIGS